MIISTYKVNEIVQRSSIGVGNIFMYRNGNGTRYASLGLYNGFHYGYKLRSLVDEKGSYHTPVKSTITPITADGKAHMFTNLGASIHHGDGIDLYCLTSDSNSETNVKHLPFQSLMADRGMVVLNTHEQKEKKA